MILEELFNVDLNLLLNFVSFMNGCNFTTPVIKIVFQVLFNFKIEK